MKKISRSRQLAALVALYCALLPAPGQAQGVDTLSTRIWSALSRPGSPGEDRNRLAQLRGNSPTSGFLLRTPSSRLAPPPGSGSLRWSLLAPEVTAAYNGRLPFSLNDGSLWAGRGFNASLTAGARLRLGPVTATIAPEVVFSQNLRTQSLAPGDTTLSLFASRWQVGSHSADLPQRFGNEALLSLRPGQSVVEVDLGAVRTGASTENQWWGPGIQNAILMSSNAEGIPHLFARTSRPARTRLGAVEARWIVGGLVESLYFDTISANDVRALSGLVATLAPVWEPNLTVGIARVVYSTVSGPGAVPGRAFDALTWWGQPELAPDSGMVAPPDPGAGPGRDQILSLFARWVFPEDGFEIYSEWARALIPTSLRDLINQPNHTQGYTLGLQWTRPTSGRDAVRVQSEATYLEESPASLTRPGKPYYVSPSIVQGYTHRGKIVGAAIGPGGSSQWVAADYLAPSWQAGLFGGRIRWASDLFYNPERTTYVARDVSIFGGARAGARVRDSYVVAELTRGARYNYLFQNPENNPWGDGAVDIWNTTLRLTVTPFLRDGP